MDEWRPIQNYENLYKVSKSGKIMNIKTGRILKGGLIGTGYKSVSLWKNRKGKNHLVHRIVAQAFVPNLNNLPEVNHKNGNKIDNKSENLEWSTHRDNARNYRRLSSRNKTGYNGVCYVKKAKKFTAQIVYKGRRKHLGCFDNPEDAARTYDEAAKKLFNSHARLNFD